MKKNKIRFGEIVADLYYDDLESCKKLVIFCAGLPGRGDYESFAEMFVSEGFAFLHPKYIGSWESDGNFSIDNCKKTLEKVLKGLGGSLTDIFGLVLKSNFEKVFVMGHSFGGSVALVVGAARNVDGIIAIAPVIDYREHNSNENLKEESLQDLFDYISKGFKNIFRGLKKEDWKSLCENGQGLNSSEIVNEFGGKNVFLAHGMLDTSVNYTRTESFYFRLREIAQNVKYFMLPKADHSSIRVASVKAISEWMSNID